MQIKEPIKLMFLGRPRAQKNDLFVRRGKGGRSFVGHSKELTDIRKSMSETFYNQFIEQGYEEPIDCLISVKFVFYCTRQWEPDLDNLPAIVLDALQGIKRKSKGETIYKWQVLKNDKLVRFEQSEKFVIEKGDETYGEPRTECEIVEYRGCRRQWDYY